MTDLDAHVESKESDQQILARQVEIQKRAAEAETVKKAEYEGRPPPALFEDRENVVHRGEHHGCGDPCFDEAAGRSHDAKRRERQRYRMGQCEGGDDPQHVE